MVDFLTKFFNGLGSVVDALAGVPPDEVKTEVNLIAAALASFGVLHVANAPALVNATVAVVLVLAAAGVAFERGFKKPSA